MKFSSKTLFLLFLMLMSAGMAAALRPTYNMADQRTPIDLEAMVPKTFGAWREQKDIGVQVVNPQQRELLEEIYSQTLSRTYVNGQGYRIMLSIAYGKNQSDSLQLHKPEICYPAQGFTLLKQNRTILQMPERSIGATQLMTQMGKRMEPVTYWTVIGDEVTYGGLKKKLTEMKYSLLDRTVPDGILVRVSSIDADPVAAYARQTEFASALVGGISPENRQRFAGLPQTTRPLP